MEDEDDFIFSGTPLPELDDDVVIRKRPNQDLTVRDEKGRQRFHGAFTGGFSAGYFNTVGTKEGWEPASFVSSRNSKASSSFQQNPEDFMDSEDFGQYGIAPKKIHTTTNFRDTPASSSRKRAYETDDVIPGEPPLRDLVKPINDSIGIRILKQMGWRHGQGIGPRVKKKAEQETNIIGCSLGPLASKIDDNVLTFAPDDTPDVPYIPKDNHHGIGYSGLSTQSILNLPVDDVFSLSKTKSWLAKDKRKLSIRGQAFGVGAFEDDDEDIYSKDDMSQYDFSEFTGSKEETASAKSNSRNTDDKYSSIVKALEGFTLGTQQPATKKYFSPPKLSANFKPKRKSLPVVEKPSESNISKPKLGHIVRSLILGEWSGAQPEQKSQSPAKPRRSRFDVGPSEAEIPSPSSLPITSSKFKPFSRDSEKQKRYEEFIKVGCNKDHLKLLQPSSMTEWEHQQEIDEFVKASVLYQPLSRALDSRFESRSQLGIDLTLPLLKVKELEPEVTTPLNVQKDDQVKREMFEWHPISLLCKRFNVPNPYPNSKDAGVPNSERKKKLSLFDNLFADQDVDKNTSSNLNDVITLDDADSPKKSQEGASLDTSAASEKSSENVASPSSIFIQETPKGVKPPMDLFKEIFQNSSSEDSSSADENEAKKTDPVKISDLDLTENDSNVKQTSKSSLQVCDTKASSVKTNSETPSSLRKGFGVFANIDLDALNKRTPSAIKPSNIDSTENHSCKASSSSTEIKTPSNHSKDTNSDKQESVPKSNLDNMYYGPAPPPAGFVPVIKNSESITHKRSKHKHKQHKHKVKKKKKNKKKHSRRDSENSSVDSDEDIPPSQILEKLKILKELERKSRKK